jgi:hypothetical protein
MSSSDWDSLNRVSFDAITWMQMDRSSRSMTTVGRGTSTFKRAGIGITTRLEPVHDVCEGGFSDDTRGVSILAGRDD